MDGDIVAQVLAALESAQTSAAKANSTFRTPEARAVSSRYFREVRHKEKLPIFTFCEDLLATRDVYARLVAFDWAFRIRKEFLETDFARFERWLHDYVDGWGSCDDFCVHAFGVLMYRHPQCVVKSEDWTQSSNRWLRRAAAVVLIYAVRHRSMFSEAFTIADLLLLDEDDLVRKGYGWLLKEVSNHDPQAVFDYVMHNKVTMPRVSLRYAVEKLDPDLKKRAMR